MLKINAMNKEGMLQHAFFMAITTGVRLLTGVVLFVLLARTLGPADFGQFAYWVTVTSLLSLLVDYGLTPKILREVGKEPASARKALGDALVTKLGFSACLFLVLPVVPFVFNLDSRDVVLMFSLMVAAIGFSFGDFICAPFRALNSYGEETKVVVLTSIIHFVLVYGAAILDLGLEAIAIVFAVSRLIYSCTSYFSSLKVLGKPVWPENKQSCFIKEAKDGLYYALDMGMANLYLQIDTVLIKLYLGSHAVGVYQAGAKLAQGFYMLPQIASNLYLPRIARVESSPPLLARVLRDSSIQLFFSGLIGYLIFSLGAVFFQERIFGHEYIELREIFPLFGLLVFTRYYSASLGFALSGLGFQRFRFKVTVLMCLVLAALSPFIIPEFGLRGFILLLAGVTLVSTISYDYKLRTNGCPVGYARAIIVFFIVLLGFNLYEVLG